jgi:predicted phage terminase large subunit-like protein
LTSPPDTAPLTAAQLDLIEHSILRNPYIPADIVPTLKQAHLLAATEDEVLYGGAVGGGKSEALLMAACQYKHLPGSNTLIVRESRDSLTKAGALVPRSKEYLADTDAHWNGSSFTWTFPSGSVIEFGYLRDHSIDRYLSAEYTEVFFEEVTDVTMAAYTALASRARRRAGNPLPVRIIATCNPPESREGEWIKHRFIRILSAQGVAASDAFAVDEDGVRTTRRFIGATGADNPHLDQDAYRRTLAMADRLNRARMLGSWTQAREGKMLDDGDLEIVDAPQHGPNVVRCRAWDLAASKPTSKYPDPDYTVGVLMSIDTQQGTLRIEDVIYMRDTAGKVKQAIYDTAVRDGLDVRVRWWRDPAQAGKAQSADLARMLARWDARGVQARTNKVTNFSPLAAAASAGRVSVIDAEWTSDLVGSLMSFPSKGVHDDDVDASSLAYHDLSPLDEVRETTTGSHVPTESDEDRYERDLRTMRGLPPLEA